MTLAHRDTTLADLLAQLGKELGVRLRTTADTQDEKVTLFLKERPAGETLTLLAEHFDFRWYRKADGYELVQTAESKGREAALREERRQAQFAPIQARIELVARLAGLSEGQRQAHAQDLNTRLAARDLSPGERQRLSEEQAALTDLHQRGAQIAVSVFRSLRPAHFTQLRERGNLLLTTMDRDLSPTLARQIHAAVFSENGGQAEPVPPGQAVWAQVLFTLQGVDDPGNHAGPRGQRGLQFSCTLRAREIKDGQPGSWIPLRWAPRLSGPEQTQRITRSGPADETLKQPVQLDLRPPASPPPGLRTVLSWYRDRDPLGMDAQIEARRNPGQKLPVLLPLGAVAAAVHQTARLEGLADSYVRLRVDANRLGGRQPLGQLLEALVQEADLTCRLDGSRLRLRSATWFEDRPAEVPKRVLQAWQEQVTKAQAISIDDVAALAAALNEGQAKGLDRYWAWYLEEPPLLPPTPKPGGGYLYYRFWNSLSAAQRQAALRGTALPVARMTPAQQRAFAAAYERAGDTPRPGKANEPRPATPAPQSVASGEFRVRVRQEETRIYVQREGDWIRAAGIVPSADRQPEGPPVAGWIYSLTFATGGPRGETRHGRVWGRFIRQSSTQ